MNPSRGYKEAQRLLRDHFGDNVRVTNAYIEKSPLWPNIKTEDCQALQKYICAPTASSLCLH